MKSRSSRLLYFAASILFLAFFAILLTCSDSSSVIDPIHSGLLGAYSDCSIQIGKRIHKGNFDAARVAVVDTNSLNGNILVRGNMPINNTVSGDLVPVDQLKLTYGGPCRDVTNAPVAVTSMIHLPAIPIF
jgi:hypothetical protein